jgi:hypothetical protein
LLAYPPSKKLHNQIIKWPQEVIPVMDQALKDCMLELAQEDQAEGRPDMQGQEGEEEIAAITSMVYKIRPFGIPAANMRSLNPSGMLLSSPALCLILILPLFRYRQVSLYKGFSHPRDPGHPRYESRLFPLRDVQPYCTG